MYRQSQQYRQKPKTKRPASRGLFSFCVRWTDEYAKRDPCHGSILIVLSLQGGYLATKSSPDVSCCVDPLNNSGIIVRECAGHSEVRHIQQTYHGEMWFEECLPRLWTAVRWIKLSFTYGRGHFSRTRQLSERKKYS